MGTTLIACPSCSCHAFARETRCPSCGAPLRAADGSIQRTAGAILLGLSVAAAVSAGACTKATSGASGGNGGQGGAETTITGGGQGGMPSGTMSGVQAVSTYGVATTIGAGGLGGAGTGGTSNGGADAG